MQILDLAVSVWGAGCPEHCISVSSVVSTQPRVLATMWPPPVKQRLVPSRSAQASPQPEENCFLGWGFLSAHHWNIPATEFKTGIVAGGCRMSSGFFFFYIISVLLDAFF